MTYFCRKARGKYVISRMYSGKYKWVVDWPRDPEPCKTDWKQNIKTLAARCGYDTATDHGVATLTRACADKPSNTPAERFTFDGGNRAGDWKVVFFNLIDAIIEQKIPVLTSKSVSMVLPPVQEEPAVSGIEPVFAPVKLIARELDGEPTEWLRIVRAVSYSEALRLDCTGSIKNYGIVGQGTADLALIECACGRLFVGHRRLVEGAKQQRWDDCGCRGDNSKTQALMMRRAWREWCTMHFVADADCALNKIMTERGLNTICKIGKFEDFYPWYTRQARNHDGNQMVHRKDQTKPFELDNLFLQEGKRLTFVDKWDDECFKLSI